MRSQTPIQAPATFKISSIPMLIDVSTIHPFHQPKTLLFHLKQKYSQKRTSLGQRGPYFRFYSFIGCFFKQNYDIQLSITLLFSWFFVRRAAEWCKLIERCSIRSQLTKKSWQSEKNHRNSPSMGGSFYLKYSILDWAWFFQIQMWFINLLPETV